MKNYEKLGLYNIQSLPSFLVCGEIVSAISACLWGRCDFLLPGFASQGQYSVPFFVANAMIVKVDSVTSLRGTFK